MTPRAPRCVTAALARRRRIRVPHPASWVASAAVAAALATLTAPCHAQSTEPESATSSSAKAPQPVETTEPTSPGLTWPVGSEFTGLDFAVLSVGAFSVVTTQALTPPDTSTTTDRLGVDERARRALRPDSQRKRRLARTSSDVAITLITAYPLLADAIVNAWLLQSSPRVATQLGMLYAESLAVTLAITGTTKLVVHRERPYGRLCADDLALDPTDCEPRNRFVSFFSSHSSVAFTAASTSCATANYLPLWGDTSPWIPCSVGYVLAGAVGTLRIVADQHYLTDVVTGAAVGTLVGWAVPWLRFRSAPESTAGRELSLSVSSNSIVARGTF